MNHTYASAGIYTVKGKYWFNNQNLSWAFYVSKIIKTPEVPIDGYYKFNSSKYLTYANLTNATFTNARSTFNAYQCKSVLKTIIFNNTTFDCAEVDGFLNACISLESVDVSGINFTSKVQNISSFFMGCTKLTEIIGIETWNVSQIKTFQNMFNNCQLLSNFSFVKSWDMSSAENIAGMFSKTGVETMSFPPMPNITTMGSIYENCTKLKVPPITTFGNAEKPNKSIYYGQMYQGTKFTIDNNIIWKIKGKCDLYRAFCLNTNSREFNVLWETDEVVNMPGLFCETKNTVTSLKTINLTSCGETIFKGYFFGGVGSQENRALTTLECTGVQSYSLNLSLYPNLSKESLLNVINCLCTTTETLQLALGSTNLSKLSADEIKIATDKGWSVIA